MARDEVDMVLLNGMLVVMIEEVDSTYELRRDPIAGILHLV